MPVECKIGRIHVVTETSQPSEVRPQMIALPQDLNEQLQSLRRKVDFDTFDVLLQQLLLMVSQRQIEVAPAYQRQFRWDKVRCSQLVESIMLGIPIPSLFMATNQNGTWELVDGVQRISAIIMFAGDNTLRETMGFPKPLVLEGLEKLDRFNDLRFSELPSSLQLQFLNRPLKVVTLSDKSDDVVRFDLFERLNRGGVTLTDQEIRDCVFRGPFADFLDRLAKDQNFGTVVRLTEKQNRDGTREECVLRFFSFLYSYKTFVHSVRDFLNDFMKSGSKKFDYSAAEKIFTETFRQLAGTFPDGLSRPGVGRSKTPLNLFEGVSVGAALAIQQNKLIAANNVYGWLGSEELKKVTKEATNNLSAVKGRIEYCRDRFLGK
jgi:hypothetical protein